MAPVNALDTPCTTALHIGERAPDVAGAIFKDRNGCFEKPSLDKEPSFQSLPKLQFETQQTGFSHLPAMAELGKFEHPKTGDCDKYFVGDRFHNAQFPHKSPLCEFHDIDLVEELKAAKTSGQESLNNSRNQKRLRSTCTQRAETHIFYNAVIMDRAHNRQIVKTQLANVGKSGPFSRHAEYKFLQFK